MAHIKLFNEFKKLNESSSIDFDEYVDKIIIELENRFTLSSDELEQILTHYRDDMEYAFSGKDGYVNPKKLVDEWVVDGKLKWKK